MSITDEAPTVPLDFSTAREPASDAARAVIANAETKQATRDEGGIRGLMLGKSDTYEVSPFDIHVKEGWNTRDFSTAENKEHVLSLAHSIAARGVQVPLTVYLEGGKLWLSDGESRLRGTLYAINALGATILSVPVRMEPRGSNDETRVTGQLVKNSGKPLSPLEKAQVVRRLMGFGWSDDKIASETGLSRARVQQLVDVLELPGAMQQKVSEGAVSATEAVRVVREHGDAAPALVEAAAALSSSNGGARGGRATRSTLRAVASARDDIAPKLTLPALLSILKRAKEDAIEQQDGAVEIRIEQGDWERICAAF